VEKGQKPGNPEQEVLKIKYTEKYLKYKQNIVDPQQILVHFHGV